jgi:hypothetical protein
MSTKQNLPYQMESGECTMGIRSISQTVKYSEFTDGAGTASGTFLLKTPLPAYAMPIGSKVWVKTGFTGDSSCILRIGTALISTGAVINYDTLVSDSTINIYTSGKIFQKFATFTDANVVQDDGQAVASSKIILTATGGSDFTSISAGEIVVTVYFFTTVPQ